MVTIKTQFRYFFIGLLLLLSLGTLAQVTAETPIPIDPQLHTGQLDNGLTYYIRQNKKPEKKVELRLVVNTGSVMEDDDQQGLAHMAEHMAFNGTRNFKKNDIVSFLQRIGVGFGNDLNAYTSFDETVYILPIPTDKPENLEKGFQVLEDWAHQVTYLDEDIETERNIILEESRLGKGADDRMFRQIYPQLFQGSKYAERLPIGKDSIIRSFQPDVIRRFYRDWYRPDLMAVIVVGDVAPATAEALVKKHFSSLTNPADQRPRNAVPVPAYTGNAGKVVTDKEATRYEVTIAYSAFPEKEAATVGQYKEGILKSIFTTLLNYRLQELTQQEQPPFIYGYTYFNSYARGYDQFNGSLGVGTADGAVKGLEALMQEIERAKRFGFTQSELDRVKLTLLSRMERAYNEREKTESGSYAAEYIRNFLEQEPIPGIAVEYEYYKTLLPQITLAEVQQVGVRLQQTPDFFVAMTGPEGQGLPQAGQLVQTAEAMATSQDIQPYEEKLVAANLLEQEPKGGKIMAETRDEKMGTKTWKLSNGTTVTIKKTDFKNDQILLGASRYGGTSNYEVADKFNANYALSVINAMGYGAFSPTDLQKAMAGKSVTAGATFGKKTDGFSASSTVKDLETMFQLLYLKATAPRVDTVLFRSFLKKNKDQLAHLMADPQAVFIDTLLKTVYHNSPLAPIGVPRPEYFDQIDLQRVLDIYRERFGNAYGMHFVIVGSIDEAVLKPLVAKYIGGLPAHQEKFSYKDNGLRPVKGKVDVNVYKGQEAKSLILTYSSNELPYSEDLAFKADAIAEVLNIRVIEELREKIQGIYGGGTNFSVNKLPYAHSVFNVQLPCGPDKVDTLLKAVNAEIAAMKTNGPSAENLEKVKQQWIEKRRTQIKENGTWLQFIISRQNDPTKDLDRFLNYEKYVEALTPKDLQQAAGILFAGNNEVTAVLYPEKLQ
ncbi:M16 family metallopeptidase [Niabella terrae]